MSSLNDNLSKQLKTLYTYIFIQNNKKSISIKNCAKLYQPKTISTKELIKDGMYYVYGANGIIGKYDKYNHEEYQITIACRGSIGQVTYTLPFSWITGNAMVVQPKENFNYKEFLYYSLLCKPVNYLTSGSVQPQLTRENLELYTLPFSNIDDVKKFDCLAKKSRYQILNNDYENIKLISLKNYLLPLLINGQATIS